MDRETLVFSARRRSQQKRLKHPRENRNRSNGGRGLQQRRDTCRLVAAIKQFNLGLAFNNINDFPRILHLIFESVIASTEEQVKGRKRHRVGTAYPQAELQNQTQLREVRIIFRRQRAHRNPLFRDLYRLGRRRRDVGAARYGVKYQGVPPRDGSVCRDQTVSIECAELYSEGSNWEHCSRPPKRSSVLPRPVQC